MGDFKEYITSLITPRDDMEKLKLRKSGVPYIVDRKEVITKHDECGADVDTLQIQVYVPSKNTSVDLMFYHNDSDKPSDECRSELIGRLTSEGIDDEAIAYQVSLKFPKFNSLDNLSNYKRLEMAADMQKISSSYSVGLKKLEKIMENF